MDYNINLTGQELGLIQIALESHKEILRKRFDEEKRYVHPAKAYEELIEKINKLAK